jgi:23S rRNA (adenine2503-C2)-methyltransferase
MKGPICLKEFTPAELEAWVERAGQPAYRGRQLLKWVYRRRVEEFQEMTDLSRDFRAWLTEHLRPSCIERLTAAVAEDGTRKFLFRLDDGETVETVLIPDGGRHTLCVSSQVGCAFGCRFCLTGRGGFRRSLSAGEIVDQICAARRELGADEEVTNVVLMGMGEPLANYAQVIKALEIITSESGPSISTRKITLSTVGLIPEMERLVRHIPINLAVSLHGSDNETRSALMPVNRRYPLGELLETCRLLPLRKRQRITFEYLLIDGVNDSDSAARRLTRILSGIRAKINLIPFNGHPELPFRQSPPERVEAFQAVLLAKHYTVTIRKSRGTGILAACGQLRSAEREYHVVE